MRIVKEFTAKQEIGQPTEDDLGAIAKALGIGGLTAEQVFIVTMALANDQLDRSFERFPVAYLNRFAETIVAKSLLTWHDTRREPAGRFFAGSVARRDDGSHHLVAKAFLAAKDPLVEKIQLGIIRDVSIGAAVDYRQCDLCQKRYDPAPGESEPCRHIAGQRYGGKTCTLTYAGDPGNVEAHEGSFVCLGCQRGAEIVTQSTRAGIAKQFVTGGALILDPLHPEPRTPDPEPKGAAMTIEEAQARIADLEKELAALKEIEAKKALIPEGEAYRADLKAEILKQAKAVDDQTLADYEAFFAELADPSLPTLKKWRDGVQKRFDVKFPPQAKGEQRQEEVERKLIAERPTAGGRF